MGGDTDVPGSAKESRGQWDWQKWALVALASLSGGGGYALHESNRAQWESNAVHEHEQNSRIAVLEKISTRQQRQVRRLVYLSILEGRHLEKVIKALLVGEKPPRRSRQLGDLERELQTE